jgi:signal transduction histidine kinase
MRAWKVWSVFALLIVIVLAAMGWMSGAALELDRQARVEENVRLALWRMESTLAPLVTREAARPYFVYSAFYPADRAYTRMYGNFDKGDVLIPSPLLSETSPYVILHFQVDEAGAWSSPQAPEGPALALAVGGPGLADRLTTAAGRLAALRGAIDGQILWARMPPDDPALADRSMFISNIGGAGRYTLEPQLQQRAQGQQVPKSDEWSQRAQIVEFNNVLQNVGTNSAQIAQAPSGGVEVGLLRPAWFADRLLLVRRAEILGKRYLQGCWLDWPALRARLLADIADLLPAATLEPLGAGEVNGQAHLLASLPIRLEPGRTAPTSVGAPSPIVFWLRIAWVCVAAALAAVGGLLAAALAFSERRRAFVSAVSHELRTPLTTFRMFTEMLAGGMVRDESKQREYHQILHAEAGRLGHMVENVLAYARLERGRQIHCDGSTALDAIRGRMAPQLVERLDKAGWRLEVGGAEEAWGATMRADATAVEQILINLIDNAVKYAAGGPERRIHLDAERPRAGWVRLVVWDHGPGIAAGEARAIFRPFHKSAGRAAATAPGIGLGLALSRRLARQMGGELNLMKMNGRGGCFSLDLPAGEGT